MKSIETIVSILPTILRYNNFDQKFIKKAETSDIFSHVNDIYSFETYLRITIGLDKTQSQKIVFDCIQMFLNELDVE